MPTLPVRFGRYSKPPPTYQTFPYWRSTVLRHTIPLCRRQRSPATGLTQRSLPRSYLVRYQLTGGSPRHSATVTAVENDQQAIKQSQPAHYAKTHTLKTFLLDLGDHSRNQDLSRGLVDIMSQTYGASSIQTLFEITDADLHGIQILIVFAVDVCVDDVVAQLAGRLHDESVGGEEWGSEVSWIFADDLDEGIFELFELGYDGGFVEGREIGVVPSIGESVCGTYRGGEWEERTYGGRGDDLR